MLRPEMVEPTTVDEAVAALQRSRGAMALAGATDLIPAIRRGLAKPRVLVNLKRIPELTGMRRVRGGVSIGALTTVADVLRSSLLAAGWPVLIETAREFGSAQIRSMATVGGNLCNATPSADFPLPLLALDARVWIAGPKGERELPLSEFFVGVNKTALAAGEIVTAIAIPRMPVRTGAAFVRLGVRRAMDLPIAAATAAITLASDGRKCTRARVALGAVAPTPMRAYAAERVIEGNAITRELIDTAAAAAARESKPLTDLRASAEYRREMTAVLVRRALEQAFARAGGAL
jgi:carbon-monoxide dehydrogenase medium subunit